MKNAQAIFAIHYPHATDHTTKERLLMDGKYRIRFFFDWLVDTPFWSGDERTRERFDYAIEPEDLPLKEETRRFARELTVWYDDALNPSDPGGPLNWQEEECDRFNQAVEKLLHMVNDELGDEFDIVNKYTKMSNSM